jgi:hypothetical protein
MAVLCVLAAGGCAGGPPSPVDPADEFDLDSFDLSLDDLVSDEPNPMAGCTLCHVDIGDLFAGSKHESAAIGCTTCHGPSKGHVADENNDVKPDEMFARNDVDRICGTCHECTRRIPAGWENLPVEQRQVCTECHGSHKLLVEKVQDGRPIEAGCVLSVELPSGTD